MTTTSIAVMGAIVAIISMVMNFFYHPALPPVTIKSKHSDFIELPYADRLDICVPYIKINISQWMDSWTERIGAGRFQSEDIVAPSVDAIDATGQQIVNMHIALENYASNVAGTSEGMNIFSCAHTDKISWGKYLAPVSLDYITGGNNQVSSDLVAASESRVYRYGKFAGVSAAGRPSKVVEAVRFAGSSIEERSQIGFSLVGGRDKDAELWVMTALLDHDDKEQWVQNVKDFKGA